MRRTTNYSCCCCYDCSTCDLCVYSVRFSV